MNKLKKSKKTSRKKHTLLKNPIEKTAYYRCQACSYEWSSTLLGPTQCPKCENLYVYWKNYEELFINLSA